MQMTALCEKKAKLDRRLDNLNLSHESVRLAQQRDAVVSAYQTRLKKKRCDSSHGAAAYLFYLNPWHTDGLSTN